MVNCDVTKPNYLFQDHLECELSLYIKFYILMLCKHSIVKINCLTITDCLPTEILSHVQFK